MCGICGVAAADPQTLPLTPMALQRMTDVIRHRGPDDQGHRLEPGIALGVRRLSVIDPVGSPQPIANEDRTVWTVSNGEIYNFRELRRELERDGHRFSTGGDTEVIVHLYEEHGADFVHRLRGMFAVAVWDRANRRLLLARDRMGVKPLYLARGRHGIAFASEVKSLIAAGIVEPSLDSMAAELFMAYGFVPGPHTLFEGVTKLMPGSVLVWADGQLVEERSYWKPWPGDRQPRVSSWKQDQEKLLALMRTSVRARLVSDVPLGVMLSGGLDSSLIAALMAEAGGGPVKTFSVGFAEDGRANELSDARRVAERLGTEHHEISTSAVDHPELLDRVLWHLEEPIADLSSIGFLLLCELAREHVTVALSGQGADELLGGYRKHQVASLAGRVAAGPGWVRSGLGAVRRIPPRGSTAARGLAALTADDPATRLLAMSRVVQAHDRAAVFTPDFLVAGAEDAIASVARSHVNGHAGTPLDETLLMDSRIGLVDNMLLYFDKVSMATSLEVRVPFMDHDLVTFCAGLPDSRRVLRMRRKELLKRASRGLVEDHIIDKKKRGFFHAVLDSWLRVHRDTVIRDTLLDGRVTARGQYRPDAVGTLVRRAGDHGKKESQLLFCLLLLERWQRLWTDADGPGARLRDGVTPAREAVGVGAGDPG